MNKVKAKLKKGMGTFKKRFFTRDVGRFLGATLLATIIITVAALYLSTIGYAEGLFLSYFMNPLTLFFNLLPVFLFITLIAMLLQSLRLSVALNGLFWCALALANIAKLSFRHANLKPEDFALIPATIKILPHYIEEFDSAWLMPGVIGVIALLIFARLMPKYRFALSSRLIAALVLVGLGALSVSTVYASTPLYKNQYIINEERWCDSNGITYRLHSDRYQANGLMYSFLYHSHYFLGPSNENYDAKNAQALDAKYGEEAIPEDQKVHIITVLLESYKDFSAEALPITLDMPGGNPFEPLHQLQEESLSGTMISDVYGGGTIKIETSVLSGLYKQPNYINHAGYTNVHYLRENGYQTIALHPNDGYFYSRHDRYPNEGFQNFLYTQNHYKNDLNKYMEDSILFDDVIDQLDRYKVNGPTFLYAATMQGHGPYNCAYVEGREWFPYDPNTKRRAYVMLNNYFDNAYRTGLELQRLIERLEAEEEPVILVYFGDHSPRMEEGARDILGLNAPDGTVQAKYNSYATQYGIWGNSAAKKAFNKDFVGELPTIDPQQMLSNVLFNYLGWHGDSYHAHLQDIGQSVTCQKSDFWTVDGVDTVIYPEAKRQTLKDLTDLNIFYRKKDYDPVEQIDERSDDKKYESESPAVADPDSSENAATRAQTGRSQGR